MNRICKFLFAFLISTTCLQANDFPKEIIIVGDSLSDSGNSRAALDVALLFFRTSPITDGTTWPVLLSSALGAKTLKPSTQGGTNFAYVGALTKGAFALFPNPSLTEQANSIPANTNTNHPVLVFGGANDIFFDPTTITNPGVMAASDIIDILTNLHSRKFDTLITFSLPDVGLIPSSGAMSSDYTRESLDFNVTLKSGLESLSFPVLQIDLFPLFNEVIFDPNRFGFTNSTEAPVLDGGGGTNTAGYVFFYDGTHPTEATHEIISQYVFTIINAPNFLNAMAQKPTSMLRQYTTNLKSQLFPIQPECEDECECNTLRLFVSGNYSPVENPALDRFCVDRCQDGGTVSLGLMDRICDDFTIGLAGGYAFDWSKLKEIDNTFTFDLRAWTISGIASFHRDHGYISGIFTAAFLDFDKIKKQFFLGPAKLETRGNTNGIDYSGHLFGAYYFIACDCNVRTGPMFDLNYQYVCIDGYKEKGASAGNLQFKDFNRNFFTSGLGWEARLEQHWSCIDLVYDFYVMGNRQWLKDKDTVRLREVSISGAYGSWPINNPKNGFVSGGAHISGCFCGGITSTLGYDFNIGASHMSEHFITIGLSFPIW